MELKVTNEAAQRSAERQVQQKSGHQATGKRVRKFWRFSLRAMMIVVTLVCVGLGWMIRDIQLKKMALERLRNEGVSYTIDTLDPTTKNWFYGHLLVLQNVKQDFDSVDNIYGRVLDFRLQEHTFSV